MDYEEKYKEALERARQFFEKPYLEDSAGIVGYIFPELKESEDEKIRKALIEGFKVMKDGSYGECTFSNYNIPVTAIIAWLEKQGEQNPAWSEEDEDNLNSAIYYIRREPYRECDVEPIVDWLRNKLKSLKDRYTWKPSDEQMDALETAVSSLQSTALESLYQDLKKL